MTGTSRLRFKHLSLSGFLLRTVGASGWVSFSLFGTALILAGAGAESVPEFWLLDWHVYYAGALDLLNGELYETELSVPGWTLPTPVFNLPPASALVALPFALMGREAGGVVWLFVGLAAVAATAFLAARITVRHDAWAWAGIGLLAYTAYPDFVSHLLLGNNNHLVLAVLVLFAWAYVHRRAALAGALLGVAISIKLWPIALLPLLVRNQHWASLSVACAVVFGLGAAMLTWLGIESTPHMLSAVRTAVPTDDDSPYIWTTWARENWSWWPLWLAPVLGWILALLPANGRAGIGLALVGGVMLVNNIWSHYVPTLLVALALVAIDVHARLQEARESRREPQTGSSRIRASVARLRLR